MKIGFYFECFQRSGGVYQIALNHLEAIREIKNHEFFIFNISPDFPYSEFTNLPNWKIIDVFGQNEKKGIAPNASSKNRVPQHFKRKLNLFILDIIRFLHLYNLENTIARMRARKRAKMFDGYGLDLLLFHGPGELSLYTKIPSVIIIHDIHHKLTPEFPEMSKLGQWEKREYLYSKIDKNAFRIYVDSETGKNDIVRSYHINPEKIIPLPPLPPPYMRTNVTKEETDEIKKKYHLPEKFLFYPAQFWPHKNHLNLVKAVKILKDKGLIVPLVFVGSKQELWGEYERVVALVKKVGLEKEVQFLGYVPVEDISPLYTLATGLVMPMYVGWTYVPIVEAWMMKCPIIYTKAHGCEEQGGDSALYVDPYNPSDIAEKIKEFWENGALRDTLIQNGQKKLTLWTKKDFNARVKKTIDDFEREKNNTR